MNNFPQPKNQGNSPPSYSVEVNDDTNMANTLRFLANSYTPSAHSSVQNQSETYWMSY